MATGLYKGIDFAELEQMRDDCLGQLSLVRQGKTVQAVTMGGKTVQKSLPSLADLQTELREITYAMKCDPSSAQRPRRNFVFDFRTRAQ